MPNNGTLVGSPTFATGKFANAISLNGTTQYVTLPNGGPQEFAAGTNWTIEGWFYATATPNAYNIICSSSNGSSPTNYFVSLDSTATPQLSLNGLTPLNAKASAPVTLNAWHSFRLVVSGSGTAGTLLIDGAVVITETGTYVKSTGQTAYIGGFGISGTYFTGLIDEVAYWTTALPNTTYTPASSPTSSPQTNLVSLYHLNSDATDSSAGAGAALVVSPTSGTAVDTSTTVSITPTLTGSVASLAASVSGGGTLSTATPTSGTAFTYTPPTTGSGTATVTVTDTTDSLTATCTITYAPPASNLAAAAITVLSATSSGWTLQANSTLGTAPKTYQWQSCATPDGTFTNVVGATGQSRLFVVTPGSMPLYVQCVVTDAYPTSVTSYGYASGAVYTGSPVLPFAVVPVADPYQVVLISDSTGTTGQNFDQTTFTSILTKGLAPSVVSVNNQSVSGTTVQGWDGTRLTTMLAGLAAGKYLFAICLGVNDSKSAGNNGGELLHLSVTSWSTHVTSICSTILGYSGLSGSKIVLIGPGYVAVPTQYTQWDDASLTLLLGYCNAIPGLSNGSTILNGSTTQRFYAFAANQALFADGVHETTAGGTAMANEYATTIVKALAGATGGGTSNLIGGGLCS
jgi:hypothetical protein